MLSPIVVAPGRVNVFSRLRNLLSSFGGRHRAAAAGRIPDRYPLSVDSRPTLLEPAAVTAQEVHGGDDVWSIRGRSRIDAELLRLSVPTQKSSAIEEHLHHQSIRRGRSSGVTKRTSVTQANSTVRRGLKIEGLHGESGIQSATET